MEVDLLGGDDLWSPAVFEGEGGPQPPLVILRQQASKLTEHTRGLLAGMVTSTQENTARMRGRSIELAETGRLIHKFYVVVPALDYYRYQLVDVVHYFEMYPCYVTCHRSDPNATDECRSEQDLKDTLRAIFFSESVVKLIRGLLAQASAVE